ncbi:MAG TPA: tetratricopeptide repeat protein [Acetobacteraceae bacterium]|nr:tetratricopeptide repeat protein [Acetobacteraceae bacterium]
MVIVERSAVLQAALTALKAGHYRDAEQMCRPLTLHDQSDMQAVLVLGLALAAQGKADAAAPLLNRVARLNPLHAHPCRDLAELLPWEIRALLVEGQYRACLARSPSDARLRFGLAELLRERGDGAGAIGVLQPLLRLLGESAEVHDQMGAALAEAGRFAEALAEFRRAVELDPAQAVFWGNLAMMLKIEGQFDAALDACDQAVARAPEHRQLRVNRAVVRLHAGRLAEAWQDEEWVLAEEGRSALSTERLLPPLSRSPELAGRTVLVVQEEGLGDTLQFLRYLPLLARRGARVAAAVPPALTRLLRTVPGIALVPDGVDAVPRFDFWCSFNSLPRVFEVTLETIPAEVPYISADPLLARRWAARLPDDGALRVGLCWAGQARPWLSGFVGLDGRRSTRLATLEPLGNIPGLRFVSLQKGPAVQEVPTFNLLDLMAEVQDFADTAALVANLDVVISVDTSVVHLAGAMGKPVFLLDRYDNCWRWLSGREDSPWYPTLRIFRQQRSGDWAPVIARVATALAAMARRPSPGRGCQDAA